MTVCVPLPLVDYLWKPHSGEGSADFYLWYILLCSPRGSGTHSNCITENLGAVSSVLLFVSLCEKPLMIKKLIYRCSLDKIVCVCSARQRYERPQ